MAVDLEVNVAQGANTVVANAEALAVEHRLAFDGRRRLVADGLRRCNRIEMDAGLGQSCCGIGLGVHAYHFLSNRLRIQIANPFIEMRIASRTMIAAAARPWNASWGSRIHW